MTNWMTAAGIALIAGGIATLICFRSVIFGRAGREAKAAGVPSPARRARRRVPEPAEDDPGRELELIDGPLPDGRDDYEPEPAAGRPEPIAYGPEPGEYEPEPGELVGLELVPDLEPADHGDHHGHRVAGWVRPEYRQVREEPPAGEYWTPIPVDLEPDHEPSAKGYGWPAPVERLPAVPDYEPATGFDLLPVEPEPTEAVISLDDQRRTRPRRSWSARNDKRPVKRERREWRLENEDPPPVARRRPRPRPWPQAEPSDRSTRVYVSRHAAEPPPR